MILSILLSVLLQLGFINSPDDYFNLSPAEQQEMANNPIVVEVIDEL